nr:transposase [Terrisporobacter sp.]
MTNFVIESSKEWQNRRLEQIYSFLFMDEIHYRVRDVVK